MIVGVLRDVVDELAIGFSGVSGIWIRAVDSSSSSRYVVSVGREDLKERSDSAV